MFSRFATTITPPYFLAAHTVQFEGSEEQRQHLQNESLRLAARSPGFLGAEQVFDPTGFGILLSFWTDRKSFDHWSAESLQRIWTEFKRPGGSSIVKRKLLRVATVESVYEL